MTIAPLPKLPFVPDGVVNTIGANIKAILQRHIKDPDKLLLAKGAAFVFAKTYLYHEAAEFVKDDHYVEVYSKIPEMRRIAQVAAEYRMDGDVEQRMKQDSFFRSTSSYCQFILASMINHPKFAGEIQESDLEAVLPKGSEKLKTAKKLLTYKTQIDECFPSRGIGLGK